MTPSPCLPYNILNVLAAYAWTVRLFNGDHQESSQDATEAILTLSPVLASNANYQEAAVAVESPKMEAQNVSMKGKVRVVLYIYMHIMHISMHSLTSKEWVTGFSGCHAEGR